MQKSNSSMLLGLLLVSAISAVTAKLLSDQERQAVLDAHNTYRCMHGANPVIWNADVAEGASRFIHDQTSLGPHDNSYELPVPYGPVGENLAMHYGSINMKEAVANWYHEVSDCVSFEDGCRMGKNDKPTGHFTALVWKGVKSIGCALSADTKLLVCRYWSGDIPTSLTANMRSGYVSQVGPLEKTAAECQSILAAQANQSATPSTPSVAREATATPIDQFPVPESPVVLKPTKAEANTLASPALEVPNSEPVSGTGPRFPVPDSPKPTKIKPPSLEGIASVATRGASAVTNRQSPAASAAKRAADEAIAQKLSSEDVVTAAADAALSEAESEGCSRDVVLREVALAACGACINARLHQKKSELPDAAAKAAKASSLRHVLELTGDQQEAQTVVDKMWEELQRPVAVVKDPGIIEPAPSLDDLAGNDVASPDFDTEKDAAEDAASSGPPLKQNNSAPGAAQPASGKGRERAPGAAEPASAKRERKVQEAGATAGKVAIEQGLGICEVFRSARDAAEADARDQGLSDAIAQKLATEVAVTAVSGASTHNATVVKQNLKACVDIVGEADSSEEALKIDLIFETNAQEQDASEDKAGKRPDEPADDPPAEVKKTRQVAKRACKQAAKKEAVLATKRGETTSEVAASVAVACVRAAREAGAQDEQALKLSSLVAARVIGSTASDDAKVALMRATVKASLGMSIMPSDMVEAIAEAAGKAQYEKSVKAGVPYEESLKLAADTAASVARAAGATQGEAVKHSATVISEEASNEAGLANSGRDEAAEKIAESAVKVGSQAGTIKDDIISAAAQSGIESGGREEMLKATLKAAEKAGVSAQKAADIAAGVADKAAFEAAKQAGATDEEALMAAAKENGKVHKALGLEWKKATVKAAGYWAGEVLAAKDDSDPIRLAKQVCGAAHKATMLINVSSPESEIWSAEAAGDTASRIAAQKKGLVSTPMKQAQKVAKIAASGAAACAQEVGLGPAKTAIAAVKAAAKVMAKAASDEGLTQKEVFKAAREVIADAVAGNSFFAGLGENNRSFIVKKMEEAVDKEVSEAQAYLQGEGSLNVETKEEDTFTCGNKAVILNGGKCSDYTRDIRNCGNRVENVSGVLFHCYAYKEPVCKTSETRCVANSCAKTCQAVR